MLPTGEWRNRIVGTGVEDAEQLLANPKNWRIHPKAQQDALVGVLKEVGWVQNVIVNQRTGYVIDGHARVALAITKGEQVPVVYVDLDENEEAIVLASMDPLAAMACTDKELLAGVLADLKVNDADLAAMLADLGAANAVETVPPVGLTEDDAVPVLPVDPATVTGDVWLLGNHRLMCGDSTSIDAVERLMAGEKADMVFTDPPYGVAVCGGTHDPRDKKNFGKGPRIENDAMPDGEFLDFLTSVFGNYALTMKAGAAIYVSHADTKGRIFREAFEASGFLLHCVVIWVKQQFVFGRSDYHWQHEPILYGWLKGASHQFHGERNQGTTWNIDRPMRSEKEHPTQKPVALVEKALQNSSKSGDVIVDLFGGSGSTMLACQKTGRHARLMELDPKYCDVIVKRWQEYTGNAAVLDGDGRTFAEINSDRMVAA